MILSQEAKILIMSQKLKGIAFANHFKEDVVGEAVEFSKKCVLCGEVVYLGSAASGALDNSAAFDPRDPKNKMEEQVEVVIGKECRACIMQAFMAGLQKSIDHSETVERES